MSKSLGKWAKIAIIMGCVALFMWMAMVYVIANFKNDLEQSGTDLSKDIGIL